MRIRGREVAEGARGWHASRLTRPSYEAESGHSSNGQRVTAILCPHTTKSWHCPGTTRNIYLTTKYRLPSPPKAPHQVNTLDSAASGHLSKCRVPTCPPFSELMALQQETRHDVRIGYANRHRSGLVVTPSQWQAKWIWANLHK